MTLRLRAHHVLCANGFRNSDDFNEMGFPDPMVANLSRIVRETLRAVDGERTRILITSTADAICAPCDRRIGTGCLLQDRIDRTDAGHAAALDLTPGLMLSWGECLDRIRARVVPADLDHLCVGCPWLPLGMCKDAIGRLHAERDLKPGAR